MAAVDADPALLALLGEHPLGALVTLKRSGRPQLSTVNHVWDDVAGELRISLTTSRAKTRNLLRDPRASYYVSRPDGSAYVVVEGEAILTEPATDAGDDTVAALVAHYGTAAGEHPDWDEYRAAMVSEGRLLLRLPVTHAYGWAR